MLDVVHYMFEEDTARLTTAEQADGISAMRTSVYQMYNRPYIYGTSSKSSNRPTERQYVTGDYEFNSDIPADAAQLAPKPYVPATEFNPESSMPFGGVLDAPLG